MIRSLNKRLLFILSLIAVLGLTGCSVRYDNVAVDPVSKRTIVKNMDLRTQQEVAAVTKALMSLGPNIDPAEARLLAHEAVNYPKVLANQYNLVRPAYLQNILVNYGYRENGLCWQWTRDMAKHIQARQWKSFDFFHGTANRRRYNEHNSLVVAAKGKGVREGMLLDPWRDSGKLYWKRTTEDPKYYWTRFTN
ncbi:hypothetical protein [Leucothrix pacifica]|uniref:Lipoprotein n=1 Tax=Leucothrix pacifica TaxID=1247513 RepID=A0A317C9M2_9GAMM|nr:hypothetical protein [Leucothrix pacifica]PWQ92752.1 hypothetical protein DKW60_19270 [Leucothrix pacifica]